MPCRGFMFVDRAFIFITAQKRLQYIASVATLQRIEERLIFSRVRDQKARNIFFSVLAGSLEAGGSFLLRRTDVAARKMEYSF